MLAISDVLFTNQPLRIVPELVYPMISDENSVERFENDVNRVHNFFYDHLGSIRCAVSTTGIGSERGDYYPDGTLISDLSWPGSYKYNGKEFDNLYRLNWLDYGARRYMSDLGQWTSVDPLAEKYYHISPYAYCANNPVNAVDPDGKLVIFINGQHGGSGGTRDYWNGLDESMMNIFGDRNSMYVDGAMGGWRNTFSIWKPNNISASNRYAAGVILGYKQSEDIISRLKEGETIKVVSHSMGAAFSKGYITAVLEYAKNRGINYENLFQIEVDLAPFQPTKQHPVENVPTYVIQHKFDGVAGTDEMPNAHNFITRKDVHFDKYNALNTMLYEHSVDSFSQKEINEKLPKR